NADDPTRVSYQAAQAADIERRALVARGESFCMETVLSDPRGDKLAFLREAKSAGYRVYVVFIGLESPQLSLARVLSRIAHGGHAMNGASFASSSQLPLREPVSCTVQVAPEPSKRKCRCERVASLMTRSQVSPRPSVIASPARLPTSARTSASPTALGSRRSASITCVGRSVGANRQAPGSQTSHGCGHAASNCASGVSANRCSNMEKR